MEGKQHTQSIMAKLMGLEEIPHKLPLPSNKKRRVLSQNYLQKTASIGRSTRINTHKHQKVVKVFKTQMPTRTTVGDTMRSLPKIIASPVGNFGGFGIDHTKKIELHFEPYQKTRHTKIIVLGPSFGRSDNTKNHLSSPSSDVEMKSINSEYKEFTRTESRPVDDDEEGVANSMEPLGNSFRVTREISRKTREDGSLHSFANMSFLAKESKKQITERWKLIKSCREIEVGRKSQTLGEMCAMAESETRPKCMHSKHEKHCFSHIMSSCSCSPLCIISGKDGYSRISPLDSRVASGSPKNSISNKASKYGCHLRKKENVDGNDSKPSYLKQKAGLECRDLSFVLNQSSGISSAFGQPEEVNKMIDDEKEIMLQKNSLYRGGKHASEAPHSHANARNIRNSSRTTDELQSEPNISHSYIEGGNTSIISIGQESWNKAHETGALSTKHAMVDRKFRHNLRETNETSPSSVLEQPFKEEKLCASELNDRHADLCSVAMQLELLDTNSEETYSEGSEMAVSSDDVSERASLLDLCQENKNILIDFNTEESRDYSYLVDVLDEVNLCDINLTVDYNIWNSSKCPVNSSVFDMLEKKYGMQESWPKSDRKLLFDFINSELSEIVHSFMDIYTMKRSLKRRCHFTLRRNEVEEELWKLLVSPKKEVCKDLSEKALGNGTRWLKLEEEIGAICGEIESFLFEELAAELAYY